MSLVEVVVAITLLAAIITPITRLVISTGSSINQSRVRVEAIDLANQDLENIQNEAYFGAIDSSTNESDITVAENGGPTLQAFDVTTRYSSETVSGQSTCQLTGGALGSPEIWAVTASVDWPGDDGHPVVLTSYIAPEQAGVLPEAAGELAVPVDSAAQNGTPYTASPVAVTVSGTWTGPGTAPTIPGNEVIFATGDTGSTGCATFDNLDAQAGWTYEIYIGVGNVTTSTVSNQTDVVTSQDLPAIVNGTVATLTSPPNEIAPSLKLGSPTIAAPFYVDPGAGVSVSFATEQCTTPTACVDVTATCAPAANLAVTAQAIPQLTGTNNALAFDTASAPQNITSVTFFPYNDYSLWAGDTVDSAPRYAPGGVPIYPNSQLIQVDATQPGPLAITLPVYEVELSVTTGSPSVTATEVNGPDESFALSSFTGQVSKTGLQLGQYSLVDPGHTVSPAYIWVTPAAIYYGSAPQTKPSSLGASKPSGTPIAVTVT